MNATLQSLLSVANEETFTLVRQMIGQEQLALLIANGVIGMTTGKLDSKAVAGAFGVTEKSAREKAENVVPKGNKDSFEEWRKDLTA
jgi:hypothetical protein